MKGLPGHNLREKLTLISTVLMASIVILLVTIHSYLNIKQSKDMARKYLVAITEGTVETVDCWLDSKRRTLAMISEFEHIRDFLVTGSGDISYCYSKPSLLDGQFEAFFIANASGTVVSCSKAISYWNGTNVKRFPWWKDFEKANYDTFLTREVIHSPISGRLAFIIVQPVRDGTHQCIGFVGTIIDWESFVEKFIVPIKVGLTGYVGITDEKGRNIGHKDRSLHLKDLSRYSWIRKIIDEKEGFIEYVYFKSVPKLMAFKQSKKSSWIVNACVNEKELVEGSVHARNVILWCGLVPLLCMVTIVGYVDIFRLGKMQKELRESERKFRLIFNFGNDGIFVHAIDPKGRPGTFREVNEVFCRMLERSKDEVLAMSPTKLLSLDFKGNYEGVVKAAASEKRKMIETTMELPDGKALHVEIGAYLLEMDSERFVLGFMRDITHRVLAKENLNRMVQERTGELKRANEQLQRQMEAKEFIGKALRESEEKYRNLVVRANDGILVVLDQRIQFANVKISQILKYSVDELVGLAYMTIIASEDQQAVMDRYSRRLRGEDVDSIYESRVVTKEGITVDVELNVGLVNYEGRPADFIYVRDITERKRIAEEKRRQEEQLIEADKLVALGTLVSGVAHEINNPNNSIMLNSPVLQDAWRGVLPILEEYRSACGDFRIAGMPYSTFKGYIRDILDHVQKSSERIKTIVDDLKNFVRPSDSELTQEVDVNEMVRASINLVSNLIMKSTRNFLVEYGESIPLVTGNYQRLEQVVVNLIQNSCQALENPDRSIRICTGYSAGVKMVQIQVYDEGKGIAAENMSKIMNPFFTTKRDSGGIGLGLSVSRKLIEDHGGSLDYESELGLGTTATILLPATKNMTEADE